ncbi:MAG TPA: MFS transporter [Acidimicrobiaceae bacterium]|nr:MFS transporter [Acidimicrobiaceae bacterium]
MTTAAPALGVPSNRGGVARSLWYRQLDSYPDTAARMLYLGIIVAATILLYYELYVQGAVSPTIIAHYGMSFRYFVLITVFANAVGAFSSLVAGLADRWGRANMVTYGLLVTALLVAFGVPNSPNKTVYLILTVAVGFVEGIILVATPALVRDFSPQLGRASAMGFWTLGPVVGSLCVSEVSSHTLNHLHAWQDQFLICGIVGLVVFAVALVGLRELSPGLRDQLMVSLRDRTLIEARAKGIDIQASLRKPWRQMLHLDIVGSAFAVSVFLIIYYTAVGFFTIYLTSIFGFTLTQANGINNWFWAFDAGALIVAGFVSDRVGVRKPFMLFGAVAAVFMTFVFATRTNDPHTGYYTFVWIISLMSIALAIAYAPWMAGFTETVEKRNPALTATGLAVWGWIIRAVVAISIFILPYVVSSTTPLVDYGTQVSTALATVNKAPPVSVPYAASPQPLLAVVQSHASLFGQLSNYPTAASIPPALLGSAIHAVGVPALLEAAKYKAPLGVLATHGTAVANALKVTPNQWKHWWWVCIGGEIVFIPLIFVMVGRWSPARARKDVEEYEARVDAELAKIQQSAPAPA